MQIDRQAATGSSGEAEKGKLGRLSGHAHEEHEKVETVVPLAWFLLVTVASELRIMMLHISMAEGHHEKV